MNFGEVQGEVVRRLDQADRGDRAWFIITRVHLSLDWLRGISEYLLRRGGDDEIMLSTRDYDALARLVGVHPADPGIQLRRHHLLAMDKPLRLIERISPARWDRIRLTQNGIDLATNDDPAIILERALREIRFAVVPWFTEQRVVEYAEFDICPYAITKAVLNECDGYVDRDEFDLFLSRIRSDIEVQWAIDCITAFRSFSGEERTNLRQEVRARVPSDKAYQNWRDVGLHTFSLFDLGTSMVRRDTKLFLTDTWVEFKEEAQEIAGAEGPVAVVLRIPDEAERDDLLLPPASPAENDGTHAESLVAKLLRSQGWTVAFYTHRRGYGFDLWATKDDVGMMVEVKSSMQQAGSIMLTETEYIAAQSYGPNYVIAVVEYLATPHPQVHMINNPANTVRFEEQNTAYYVASRIEWLPG
jgi:Protein NO VEIN, C-terminal